VLSHDLGEHDSQANALSNLGEALARQGRCQAAFEPFEKAFDLFRGLELCTDVADRHRYG
jgi:Flp pilus assembly protein TadD